MNILFLRFIVTFANFCINFPVTFESFTQKILVEASQREYLSFFVDFMLSGFALLNIPQYIFEQNQ